MLLRFGDSDDLTIVHDASDTSIINTTGDFTIGNTDTLGKIILRLGTDNTTTAVEIQNLSGTPLLTIDGSGVVKGFIQKDYLLIQSTTQTLMTTGTDFTNFTVVDASGGDLNSGDVSAGVVSLNADKIYRLQACIRFTNFTDLSNGQITFNWVNSSNTPLYTNYRGSGKPGANNQHYGTQGTSEVIYSTYGGVDTDVHLRVNSATGFAELVKEGSFMIIQEL